MDGTHFFRSVCLAGLFVAVASLQGCGSDSNSSAGACTAKDVTLQLGQPVPDGGQYVLDVFISNVGSASCVVSQRPAVKLLNESTTGAKPSIDIASSGAATTATVAVPASAAVKATLTFIAGPDAACDAAGPWVPTRMVVTLDKGLELTAGWPGGPVDDCQGSATQAGTFIGPFAAE